MFESVSSKAKFSDIETEILDFWEKEKVFSKSLQNRSNSPEYIFYDGPPFATGLPHYGHLLAGTIKDVIPRYKTMKGYYVERRFGWDCHGLPVEYEVEQMLSLKDKNDIEKIGVDKFNETCRSIVLRYTREWRSIVKRIGRWVDFDNEYRTMDPYYMESIWWVVKTLWNKGLIYEGYKILPYCPRCATPLSNFETNQGYREVKDPSITVRFEIEDEPNSYILAWTTTPWTLPSNVALAVGTDIKYVRVKEKNAVYYLAKERLEIYYPDRKDIEEIEEIPTDYLVGKKYKPIFPYFAHLSGKGAFRIIQADFVSTEDGTGVVHIAPGFGEEDYLVGIKENLPIICPVDENGRFTADIKDFSERPVKDSDEDIILFLKQKDVLVHKGTILHTYPFCWRCDTPLIYKAVSTWFVRVEEIKEKIIKANETVNWIPEHLKYGRFGKWLEGARDWAISRNRYWGTPIPIWRSEDKEEVICIGSIAELEQLSGKRVEDLHKHFIDHITIPSKKGHGELKRIPEVLDCWFESGAMPYAQAHYPFEKREHFEKHFPADFIAEGLDQTRGWFYTLMVLSVALFDKPAFKNVIVNGLVLAEDGKKLSKRLKNYPDPSYILNTYGADALRLYMLSSPVVKAEELRFSESGLKQIIKDVLLPLWNAYSFLVTYANIDKWTPSEDLLYSFYSSSELDRWILACLQKLIKDISENLEKYDLQNASYPIRNFVDQLTNWYIRRSRRRFWKTENDNDKQNAYSTLWIVLINFCMATAPLIPFITEAIYRNLRLNSMPQSVHLNNYPEFNSNLYDEALLKKMHLVTTIVHMARHLRTTCSIKTRQPLKKLFIVCKNIDTIKTLETAVDIISDELNVKEISFRYDDSELVSLTAKPNYKAIGPRFGQYTTEIAKRIEKLTASEIKSLESNNSITFKIDGEEFKVTPNDIIIIRTPLPTIAAISEGDITVGIDTEISAELLEEGLAREFVHKIQNTRKDKEFNITDRITIKYYTDDPELIKAISKYSDYIRKETLGVNIYIDKNLQDRVYDNLNGRTIVYDIEIV